MGTTDCSACGGQVSPSAKQCPHCGEPDPAFSIIWAILGVSFLIGIALLGANLYKYLT